MIIAERIFVIDSSREKIWELILKAVLRFMPFERIDIRSEKIISALLRMKIWFISVPMNVEIEIAEMSPPESMVTILRTKGILGMVWLNQKATFRLATIGTGETEVACRTVDEGMSSLLRMFLLRKVKSFAEEALENLENLLRKWVS